MAKLAKRGQPLSGSSAEALKRSASPQQHTRWISFKKCIVLIHCMKHNLYSSPWTLICMLFAILFISLSFLKTLYSRFRDTGEKNGKYCGVLVTKQRATLQLCRWNETPTSLMVNNSNNDGKDNYTNDASSSCGRFKKSLKLKNGFWKSTPECLL